MSKLTSAADAAARIPDGAVVTVSSSSALGCPDLVLQAIGDRFDATGHPRNLTTIHPIAAGDMYGVKGVDHIAKDGLVLRIVPAPVRYGSRSPAPHTCRSAAGDGSKGWRFPRTGQKLDRPRLSHVLNG